MVDALHRRLENDARGLVVLEAAAGGRGDTRFLIAVSVSLAERIGVKFKAGPRIEVGVFLEEFKKALAAVPAGKQILAKLPSTGIQLYDLAELPAALAADVLGAESTGQPVRQGPTGDIPKGAVPALLERLASISGPEERTRFLQDHADELRTVAPTATPAVDDVVGQFAALKPQDRAEFLRA